MKAKNTQGISVFFPCYNDENSIDKLVTDAFDTLKSLTDNYEVIVVDDGSTDNSLQILKALSLIYPKLKIVIHKKNKGYGGALRSGFNAACKSLIFYTDGDGQYDVKELSVLLKLMTPDVNFINGIKMARRDPTYRIFIGNLYSSFIRWAFWVPTYDIDCDFRLIRKNIVKKINLKSNSGSITVELVKKAQRAGAKFRQVSVHHYERRFGKSQFFRPEKIISTFAELGKLWFRLMVMEKLRNKISSRKKACQNKTQHQK